MSLLSSLRTIDPDIVRANLRDGGVEQAFGSIPEGLRYLIDADRTKLKIEFYQSCAELFKQVWPDVHADLPSQLDLPEIPKMFQRLDERFEFLVSSARSCFYDFDTKLLTEQTEKHPELVNRIEQLWLSGGGEISTSIGGIIESGFSGGFQTIEHCFSDPVYSFLRQQRSDFHLDTGEAHELIEEMKKASVVPAFLAMRHFQRNWDLQAGRRGNHFPWMRLNKLPDGWQLVVDESQLQEYDSTDQSQLKTPAIGCPFHMVPQGLSEFSSWVLDVAIAPCIRALAFAHNN